jgi:hypothetical protein
MIGQQMELDDIMAEPRYTGQHGKIMALFKARKGQWIPLYDILGLRIAQYGRVIHELRKMGEKINNRVETVDGQRHSWFMWEGSE